MSIPDEAFDGLRNFMNGWEHANPVGYVVIALLPGHGEFVGNAHYFTFGPAENSENHTKLIDFMDKVMDAVGTRLTKN